MIPRSFLVPEVIQTSLMDCGPAALQAVLEGFGIAESYESLRERCQTDVDGTSIDALAALARQLGLESHQVLVPRDHFLLPEAACLPAIVVTRSGSGSLHFLVVWRVLGPWVQIMDPSGGRSWAKKHAFLERMPDLDLPISMLGWRRWAASENALAPLRARMDAAGLGAAFAERAIAFAKRDETWRTFAALDAAVRMVTELVRARATSRGVAAERLLEGLLGDPAIPQRFWWVSPSKTPGKLTLRGAVIVHFSGRGPAKTELGTAPLATPPAAKVSPLRQLYASNRQECRSALALLLVGLAASAALTTADTLLARGAVDLGRFLALDYQRATGIAALAAFAAIGLGLELSLAALVQRVGRGLETRLRVALLEKIPRLEDRYLRSRPTSDMASRGHQLQSVRELPQVVSRLARAVATLIVTTAAIGWLVPAAFGWALAAAVLAIVVPVCVQRPLAEVSLRLRTQSAALETFYLDALLGVTPIRVHGAERAVRREHESLLTDFARTARALQAKGDGLAAAQLTVGTLVVVLLVVRYLAAGAPLPALLLLAFWAFRIPAAGQDLVRALGSLRDVRHVAARLLAPLSASEVAAAGPSRAPLATAGARIEMLGVTVSPGGNAILQDVQLTIAPGTHVAIVGASGAGKSSLAGLLLGWLTQASGRVLVDGAPLDAARLRGETAWIDPGVQLWNRSLLDNVAFGGGEEAAALARLPEAVKSADLGEVLETLPGGLSAGLGEGGVRLSGGQGQRVRLARGLMRQAPRLVILDEPFRGLERPRRQELLARTRARFRASTLLFVSHDVNDTQGLDRVLVLENGRIVEDGAPATLLANPASRYRALVAADAAARQATWSAARWQRRIVRDGRLEEGTR